MTAWRSKSSPKSGVLTKYFSVIPKSNNKEGSMAKETRKLGGGSTFKIRRGIKRGSTSSLTISPPSSPIDISSDDDFDPPRRKRLPKFTIKQLFDDSIPNKPPVLTASAIPCRPSYLKEPSPENSSCSDSDLPSIFTPPPVKRQKLVKPDKPKSIDCPVSRDAGTIHCSYTPKNFKDASNEMVGKRLFRYTNEDTACLKDDLDCSGGVAETMFPNGAVHDPAEEILERLTGLETKRVTLEVVTDYRAIPKKTCQTNTVSVLSGNQEERVEHYLTMCMASPSLKLLSAVNYLKMVTSHSTIPSGDVIHKIWRTLLLEDNQIKVPVAECAVRYFSSLLLLQPPFPFHRSKAEYSAFVKCNIGADLLQILAGSVLEWKVVLLEFISGLLLQDYRHSLMHSSKPVEDSPEPLLFEQVFWPGSKLYHVNMAVRSFISSTVAVLQTDITTLMIRKLCCCGQILYLLHSQCDITHELSLYYQRIYSTLHQSKHDLFLSTLRPFNLALAIHKDASISK